MFKKILIIFFLTLPVTNCTTLSDINEKLKGDGTPYIPGI
tara:strand:- start:96 stop:215 length:120 start_codon:yes stop_codon:yes gene_type:complete